MTTYPFAFWLTPAQPYHDHLMALIQQLARQYDAVPFEPHMTLFVGTHTAVEDPLQLGASIAAATSPIQLETRPLEYTDFLFKTLFVTFADCPVLSAIVGQIKAQLQQPGDYELDPHLSLLYKTMPAAVKQEIIASLGFNIPMISFDQIDLVTPNKATQDWADIAGWRTVQSWQLFPENDVVLGRVGGR